MNAKAIHACPACALLPWAAHNAVLNIGLSVRAGFPIMIFSHFCATAGAAGAAERTRKLHEAAKRFEEQERAWKVRLSLPAQGATTGMSRRSSSKRLLSSASTASLGM